MLLTAMFMASCYWPPVSLDTPLSRPWSDNVTTFGDALLSRIPDLPADLVPAAVPIVDRCWCDFSMGFFEPFNSTRWEWNSVEKLRRELEQKLVDRGVNVSRPAVEAPVKKEDEPATQLNATSGFSMFSSAASTLAAVQRRLGFPRANSTAAGTPPDTPPPIVYSSRAAENDTYPGSLLKEYDLRPYGFDMIVDLSWPHWP